MSAGLPTRRFDIAATDLDGRSIRLSLGIAKQLYRCPGCRESLAIGAEHVIVAIAEPEGERYHQHWHSRCVAERLLRELRGSRREAR